MESIVLEDGLEYAIVDEINYQDKHYVYLLNVNDNKDFCIRKSTNENGVEYAQGLDNKEEYETALNLYLNKNKSN